MKGEPETGQPFREHGHDRASVPLPFAADDTVSGKAHQAAAALHPWPSLPFTPGIEDMMEADRCPHGGKATALDNAGLGVRQRALCHHSSTQPLPHEAEHPAILDPLAQHLAQASAVEAVAVSTHSGIHDPADALRPAPLA
jgi:hypothetical protein